jgi:sterol 14-demethylase
MGVESLADYARDPWVLCATLVLALVVVALLGYLPPRKGLPPIVTGLPIVGSLIGFLKRPYPLALESFKKYGPVFTLKVPFMRLTFLVGPEASAHYFKAKDSQLDQQQVYQYSVPIFGKGIIYDVDIDTRQEQFKFLTNVFRGENMRAFAPEMQEEAEMYFAKKWGDKTGETDLRKDLAELIILTAARCLMGPEVRNDLSGEVSRLFQTLDEGMIPITFFFPNLPIHVHRARDRARQEMANLFSGIMQARRNNPDKKKVYHDCLNTLMNARYRDESRPPLTDDQISGMMIALLFAGQHTSSVTSSWTGYFLLDSHAKSKIEGRQDEWEMVRREQDAIVKEHGKEIDFDVLEKMDRLHASIKEALRIHPPLIFLVRKCLEDFEVCGVTVPKGDIVFASPPVTHRVESVFPNPESYEPERFLKPREEDKQRFSFVGFGGGRHGCLGENFAYMQIKTIWSVLLRKYDMELVDPLPEPDYSALVVGPMPCRVRYTPRKK